MQNLNQIESDILNKIKNVNNRNSYDQVKTEIFHGCIPAKFIVHFQ